MNAVELFLLTFIPLFVAIDAIGTIPIFVTLVGGASKKQKYHVVLESVTTAAFVAIIFMFIGKWILRLLGVTIPDFQIAGGALLFIISVILLLPGMHKGLLHDNHDKDVGIFPLGTPLITGPAVLTTTLILVDAFGVIPTFISLILNMTIVWICLSRADSVMKLMGRSGIRAFSKIMYILLASIGVMMVRRGILGVLGTLGIH